MSKRSIDASAYPARTATSYRMSRVRSKNTTPELAVRKMAHRLGFRFRLHRKDLPGTPDLVFPRLRAAVFVNGCFWHRHKQCSRATVPSIRTQYWLRRFARNVERDQAAKHALECVGWRVLIIWECELRVPSDVSERLVAFLRQ